MFNKPVVFVDIETTGMSAINCRVIEVAAIRYEQGKITQQFSSLVNPESHLPAIITSITGISPADVSSAPTFEQIADELLAVCSDALFIAHNVHFDHSFLRQEFLNLNTSFDPQLFCTVRLSRRLYKHHKSHSLATLIDRHAIPVQARHRALDDARAILHFSELAYKEHGPELFDAALRAQLKTQ